MCVEGEGTTLSGAHGKANVGISNDKECVMHSRRKTKVSRATLIGPGVSRVLRISRMARPMEETVNIPLLSYRAIVETEK